MATKNRDPSHPESPAATAAFSLKSIAQQLILDTLELDQIILSKTAPVDLPQDDLVAIPHAFFQQGIAAHAALAITRAVLEYLPQLEGRIKAIHHIHESAKRKVGYHATTTTYLITTKDGDSRTLVVETFHGYFATHHENESWAHAKLEYSSGPGKASFAYDNKYTPSGTDATLSSSNLDRFFDTLARDLQLPVKSTKALKAAEKALADTQEVTRARLGLDADAAKGAHKCGWRCRECDGMKENLAIALDHLDRPSVTSPLRKLQTLDAKQRDMTFGRLIRALLPRDFRRAYMEAIWELDFMGEQVEHEDVENMLRQAAVAGRDLDETYDF
ncbi:hypothetical protein RQP46_008905 [Phenoliferia psychrophenolica]